MPHFCRYPHSCCIRTRAILKSFLSSTWNFKSTCEICLSITFVPGCAYFRRKSYNSWLKFHKQRNNGLSTNEANLADKGAFITIIPLKKALMIHEIRKLRRWNGAAKQNRNPVGIALHTHRWNNPNFANKIPCNVLRMVWVDKEKRVNKESCEEGQVRRDGASAGAGDARVFHTRGHTGRRSDSNRRQPRAHFYKTTIQSPISNFVCCKHSF